MTPSGASWRVVASEYTQLQAEADYREERKTGSRIKEAKFTLLTLKRVCGPPTEPSLRLSVRSSRKPGKRRDHHQADERR